MVSPMTQAIAHTWSSKVAGDASYRGRPAFWPLALLGLAGTLSGCISPGSDPGTADALKIGVILPFTGELAASGPNIESALIMVRDAVNASGGLAGRPLRLVTRDSSSDPVRGLSVAHELVDTEEVFALIGPEDDELAWTISPLVRERNLIAISGGITSPRFINEPAGAHWFRTIPPARSMGNVLARELVQDGIKRLTILHASDEYGKGFANMVQEEYEALGGAPVNKVSFEPNQASYSELVRQVVTYDSDGIVLVAYPRTGALIIQEWAPLHRNERWYFAHALKNQMFLLNVPPGSIEGMKGVSPALSQNDQPVFARMFADRWRQDYPLPAAFYNYDALALLALAIEKAFIDGGGVAMPTREQVAAQVLDVSRNPKGKNVGWDRLEDGLHLIRYQDQPFYEGVNYRGVSGSLDLDDSGQLSGGLVEVWGIESNQITTLAVAAATAHAQR
jgi:ABC-type branched-subunit amino acid transport system substrate-binding protein